MDQDVERRIRDRAHSIWEQEGRPAGRDVDHWLRAAQEIAAEEGSGASAADAQPDEKPKKPRAPRAAKAKKEKSEAEPAAAPKSRKAKAS